MLNIIKDILKNLMGKGSEEKTDEGQVLPAAQELTKLSEDYMRDLPGVIRTIIREIAAEHMQQIARRTQNNEPGLINQEQQIIEKFINLGARKQPKLNLSFNPSGTLAAGMPQQGLNGHPKGYPEYPFTGQHSHASADRTAFQGDIEALKRLAQDLEREIPVNLVVVEYYRNLMSNLLDLLEMVHDQAGKAHVATQLKKGFDEKINNYCSTCRQIAHKIAPHASIPLRANMNMAPHILSNTMKLINRLNHHLVEPFKDAVINKLEHAKTDV